MKRYLPLLVAACAAVAFVAPIGSAGASSGLASTVKCDGTWHILKTPVQKDPVESQRLFGVAVVSATDAWAVGDHTPGPEYNNAFPLVEHWDGAVWTKVKSPLPSGAQSASLFGISALSASDVWAVGMWVSLQDGSTQALVEHYNGTKWKLSSTGRLGSNVQPAGVVAISSTNVWLVGSQGPLGSHSTMAAQWNGSSWKKIPTPNHGSSDQNSLVAVSAVGAGDIWASGWWTDLSTAHGLTEHWNGTAWSIVPSTPAFTLTGVAAIARRDAWVGGIDNNESVVIEHWNGTSWSASPAPLMTGSNVNAMVASSTSDVWLVGGTVSAGPARMLAEHWDGGSWSVIKVQTPKTTVGFEMHGVDVTSDGATAISVGFYEKTDPGASYTMAEINC